MHPIVSVIEDDFFVYSCISVFNTRTCICDIKKDLFCLVIVQPSSVRIVRTQNDIFMYICCEEAL